MPLPIGSANFRAPLASESHAFVDCVEKSFGIHYTTEQRERFITGLDTSLALVGLIEGNIVATLAGHYLTQTLAGARQVRTLALTDIGVVASARGQGVFRLLVERCLHDAERRGDVLSVLSTEHHDLYARHGFGRATSGYSRSIDGVTRQRTGAGTVVHLTSTEALAVIPTVFAPLCGLRPGELERPLPLIEELLAPGPSAAERRVIGVLRDEVFTGYAVFERPRANSTERARVLRVLEVAALSEETSVDLWSALFELGGGRLECVELPGDEPFAACLVDASGIGAPRRTERTLNRLIDLRCALESRGYLATGSLVFDVNDPILPMNSGIWKITTNNSGNATVARTTEPSEISLSMALLATLFSGDASSAELSTDPTCVARRDRAEHAAVLLFGVASRPYCTALC